MTFVILTHVPHTLANQQYYAYAPYVREMNSWAVKVEELLIVAPIVIQPITPIETPYIHNKITFVSLASFDIVGFKNTLVALFKIPKILVQLFLAMQKADHIHLRCPGNVGLLASVVQMLFPKTPKSAKYAGNWDPESKQPWTYHLQKWIISNSLLTRNMQVLVYGEWKGSSKNIKPFFTATYAEADKIPITTRNWNATIHFVFVGTLVKGKNPLYAIQLVELLSQKGFDVSLTIYGDGVLRTDLEQYIAQCQLQELVRLVGNQTKEIVQKAYQESHFVVLPSDSEGWPKVVSEGMFWGCIPLSTAVSCVPYMLDYGKRGVIVTLNLDNDSQQLADLLQSPNRLETIQKNAANWSRLYTVDVFEAEIKKILRP